MKGEKVKAGGSKTLPPKQSDVKYDRNNNEHETPSDLQHVEASPTSSLNKCNSLTLGAMRSSIPNKGSFVGPYRPNAVGFTRADFHRSAFSKQK